MKTANFILLFDPVTRQTGLLLGVGDFGVLCSIISGDTLNVTVTYSISAS